jgi:hypothetical protein
VIVHEDFDPNSSHFLIVVGLFGNPSLKLPLHVRIRREHGLFFAQLEWVKEELALDGVVGRLQPAP